MNVVINEKIIPNLYFFKYKERILGLDKQANGIFEVNETNRTLELKGVISKVYGVYAPFSKVVVHEECLYFIPYNYDKLLVYHIADGLWEEIDLGVNKDLELFLEAFVLNDILYLLPFNYDKMVKIDTKTKNVEYVDFCKKHHIPIKKEMFIKFLVLDNENVILPILSTNQIIKYNIAGGVEIIELANRDFQINSITRGGDYIFLASKNSLEALKLNLNLEVIECFKIQEDIIPIGTEYTYFDHSGFEYVENQLYLFPARWNHVVKINVVNGRSKIIDILDRFTVLEDSEKISKFNHGIVVEGKLYIQHYDKKILVIDLVNETFQTISTDENDPKGINFKSLMNYIIDK